MTTNDDLAALTTQEIISAVEGNVSDHEESVWSIAWHPKYSNLLATCSSDKTVRLYYVRVLSPSGRLFAKCIDVLENQHNRTIRRVDWSLPSGNALACASFDGTSSIWILLQNKLQNHLQALEEESQNSKESSPTTSANLGLLKCVSTLEGHENEVKSVAWNYKSASLMDQSDDHDGEDGDCGLLATCGRDKTVWVWEAIDKVGFSDFDCNSVCSGHTQDVKFVAWHPLTRSNMPSLLYSASYDNTIRIWKEGGFEEDHDRQSDEWKCVGILRGHTSTVWGLAFEPQLSSDDPEYPQYMVSVGDDKSLILWREDVVGNYIDMNVTQVQTISDVHTRTIYYVDWCVYKHPSTGQSISLVATAGGDNTIAIYQFDTTTRQLKLLTKIANAHDSDINCCIWNKNEFGLLSSCSDDGAVKFWKLKM
ncbi:WD40 repeat domain-containing protein [Naegleria gruberi]|uniref:Probable cytosolic iron-sulfur protein assembly protein CIAO1 homolog n=1 Tax=Naegleria gruberi TaxID=5762 RepID=D2V4Z9_NAEGR|nr:WD40 repeat domain-containing protein [Naegleria gruberi]EFC48191.1 WD40 repeat domain-containing protein [Naegleria gruberi]|eukprot:XP_002680935.1 WD40 repeat domain-containing protein [Naegleria gruberi strain NEG-M]